MDFKHAIFITVRTSSTRLPQKCLLPFGEVRTIEFLIRRLKRSKLADGIILCTTQNPEDDILCEIADREGIAHFRGSERDKLVRWQGAADKFGVEFFVTADGDDLFCEAELIDLGFAQHLRTGADFIEQEGLICGCFTYGIKAAALRKVCEIKDSQDTEMMWVYFKDTGLFRCELLGDAPNVFQRPEIRMTLDYPDDLMFFKTCAEHFWAEGRSDFDLRDVMGFLDANPEVIAINQYLQDAFLQNQKAKTTLVLKGAS
jgi:spore coat polysaccharide biosynthesis protein SpsF